MYRYTMRPQAGQGPEIHRGSAFQAWLQYGQSTIVSGGGTIWGMEVPGPGKSPAPKNLWTGAVRQRGAHRGPPSPDDLSPGRTASGPYRRFL